MPEQLDLYAATKLPPKDALEWFRAKGFQITGDYRELWAEAHARAFTVAKAARLDVLKDIRGVVDKALAEGQTLASFKKELTPLLKKKGWWGKVQDEATGKTVQLGSPHRLATIYRTNLQTAYQAGRYKAQIEDENRPYLQYVAVMDQKTRPAHAALNGKVFRADDPIWDSLYPPNDWGCRCRVRALSESALKKKGLAVESSEGRLRSVEVQDPVTGEVRPLTVYEDGKIKFYPGQGWDYNPGQHGLFDRAGLLPDCGDSSFAAGPAPSCIAMLPGQKTWLDFGRPDLVNIPDSSRLPMPKLLERAQDEVQALGILAGALGLAKEIPHRWIDTPVDQVLLRYNLLPHMVEKRADARERYANYILPTLENPFEIYLTAYDDGFRKRYLGLFEGKNQLLCVVRVNKDGGLLWNIMHADLRRMNKVRVGELLYGK